MSESIVGRSSFFSNFRVAFEQLLSPDLCSEIFTKHWPRGGGSPKLSHWEWLMARVYHELARSGSFSSSVRAVTRVHVSDSALSQRAVSIGEKLIEEVLPVALHPLADPQRHADAFYNGLRLLAVDGTRFNLRNTDAINEQAIKVTCSRGSGEPAYSHLLAVVLIELGMHQPLAARLGWQSEGELTLARSMFATEDLPQKSLLLADRLFGPPPRSSGKCWTCLRARKARF